ncbi:MAG: hypothetical protein RJA70_2110 [Pseudomonadota bacterium]
MELSGKRVIVLGLGRSGQAAGVFCCASGAQVLGTDSRPESALPEAASLRQRGLSLVLGGHAGVAFSEADLIVVSPGVPNQPFLDDAERAGVEVIGELELACRFASVPIVAVGGTNGKSTTTTLVEELLRGSGAKVFAGGNLGVPACEAIGQGHDLWVLEVSSFQLERALSFRPRVSVLLNITEDHLDRYASFADYALAKGNAFVGQSSSDLAVIPHADELCRRQALRGRARVRTFGPGGDYSVIPSEKGHLGTLLEKDSGETLTLRGLPLHGAHNGLNLAAAVACARDLGCDWTSISRGLQRFQPLEHRMQRVRELEGVTFYDDSKGTNVGAVVTAIHGLSEARCVLIAGGRDKLGSYEPLVEALRQRGRGLVVLGEAKERIAEAARGVLPVESAENMQQAVKTAFRLAHPGDAVLLSPACSSFDMFSGYKERGEVFSREVLKLTGGTPR